MIEIDELERATIDYIIFMIEFLQSISKRKTTTATTNDAVNEVLAWNKQK